MNLNWHLTRNFQLWEVFKSRTAENLGWANIPDTRSEQCDVLLAARALARNILQPIRDAWGAIYVTSWYRTAALNRRLGGAVASQHTRGEAADFIVGYGGEPLMKDVFDSIVMRMDLSVDQLIYEERGGGRCWIHVSYQRSGDNRGEILISPSAGIYLIYNDGLA